MTNLIYLDNAATTPIDPRVAQKMQEVLLSSQWFANPSSVHQLGQKAHELVEIARAHVAQLLQAEASEIIWTSGATESNNLAIKGVAHLYQRKGKHIVTLKTEHKSVLDPCQHLEKEGYEVTYLTPEKNGLLNLETFKAALRPDTILASIMHVNNETGVIQDLNAIAAITSAREILLHVDAAQSIGKIALNVKQTPVDLISLCAHKIYGPKGIGALYLRKKPRVRVVPLIHGGGQEQGMRSGTLATHQIVGMGTAFSLAAECMLQEYATFLSLRNRFLEMVNAIPSFKLNSDLEHTAPHILNLRFTNMLADVLLSELPQLVASTASACQGKGTDGSYVLRAMGLTEDEAKSSLRISFGRFTTLNEVEQAASAIQKLFQSR